jgi:hypothetical protein
MNIVNQDHEIKPSQVAVNTNIDVAFFVRLAFCVGAEKNGFFNRLT